MSQQLLEGYEVSPQQKHVWALCGVDGQAPYLAQCTILMEGALDQGVLKDALQQVLDRHEILRTTFDVEMPLQIIDDSSEVWFDECNLNGVCAETQSYMLDYLVRDTEQRHFGPGSICRPHFSSIRLTPNKHLLVVILPSLYADTAALSILMREVGRCYAACINDESIDAVSIQYADLCQWQNESLTAPGSEVGRDYWRRQHDSTSPKLPFENDSTEFDPKLAVSQVIDSETVRKLMAIGEREGSSLSSCLLAAFFVLLARLTEQSRLSIGVGFDGRNYEELVEALGLFARFLPIDAEVAGLSFVELLAALEEKLAAAEQWQELYVADEEGTPFCFAYEAEAEPQLQVTDELQFRLLKSSAYVSRFKVWLRCLQQADGAVVAEWHYDRNRYSEAELKRVAEGWSAALASIVATEGSVALSAVQVVGASEQAALLDYSRGADEVWDGPGCVHERFAAQVARTPAAVAVVYEDEKLSYSELNQRANQLARNLRARGVGAEQRVGLMLERSLEMVVGMLGILKAGGTYVPLEPRQPAERLRRMVQDAGVRVLVSVAALSAEAEALGVAEQVYLDRDAELSGDDLESVVTEQNAAYVIYTSGSTGSPKGVCVEHRQLNNYINSISKKLDLPGSASYALVSTFAADLGNTVIFPALCTGGTLHVISNDRTSDADALAHYFAEHTIDCLKIVPSHLAALLTHSQPELILPRKCLVLGGESSTQELIDRIQTAAPECRILNHYGPTETTVGVLTFPVIKTRNQSKAKTIPVGGPIANTETYVLDQFLNIVPFGVAGELYIGGANLSRGYLSGAEAAAEKFIPNPFSTDEGARLYKTGDLARYLPDGNIEFLGRADDQIKVRGFRVEPGEIETAISRHEGIAQAKVLPHDSEDGKRRLVAYLVPDEDRAATVRHWLRFEKDGKLQRRQSYELPNGMVIASQNKNETDFMYREIFEDRIYAKHGIKLNAGDCIFDVGANIGMFSLFAGQACSGLKIYAFEPMPSLFELLKANLSLYNLNATVLNYALGSKQELQEFTYYPHLTLLSGRFANQKQDQEVVRLFELNRVNTNVRDEQLLDEVLSERLTGQTLTCKTKRLSDVISEYSIERIDLLKIDVQKSELNVLQGIDEEHWSRIQQVVLEVHDIDGRLGQIVSLLEAHGFQVAIQQEAMLKKTGMYDLYCVRSNVPHQTNDIAEETAALPEWTNPDALVADVRGYLHRELPEYMIPSSFVLLDSLPLTPNGKIDRQALPEPSDITEHSDSKIVRPRNAREEVLAEIWCQVLNLEEVGVEDNFFALGGDSILSIQIVARANQAGLKLTPKDVFRHQTIAALAAASGSAEEQVNAEQGLLTGIAPLTPIQHYFFAQQLPEPQHFNQSLLLRVHERLEVEQLQTAVRAVMEQHDALRLQFTRTTTGWEQRYGGAEVTAKVEVVDVSGDEQAITAASDRVQRSLRLESGALLRVVLFETGAEQRLLLVAHHLIVDGVSWRILVEDLGRALQQLQRGERVSLGVKTSSYRSWGERLVAYAESESLREEQRYWEELAQCGAQSLPLIAGENTIATSRSVARWLDIEETRALLQEVPAAYRTQINEVLLTALVEAMGQWNGRRQLLVDLEGHGRNDELFGEFDLTRTIGWFTNVYPVWLDLEGKAGLGAALKHVKEELRRVPNRGLGYGVLRYMKDAAETSEGFRAIPEATIRFNYFGQLDNVLPPESFFTLSHESTGAERGSQQRRSYLLDVIGMVSNGRLQLNLIYSDRIHSNATIENLADLIVESLRSIIDHCQSPESDQLSPSDFPLANLNQAQLDRILSRTIGGME